MTFIDFLCDDKDQIVRDDDDDDDETSVTITIMIIMRKMITLLIMTLSKIIISP